MYKWALLNKLQFFLFGINFTFYKQATGRNFKLLIYFLLLLLAYNYSRILINSEPCLDLVHSHVASCRLTASGLSGFPALCTWSHFIPKLFHTLLCILYDVIIFHLAKVQIKICKLNHFACVFLIFFTLYILLLLAYNYTHIIINSTSMLGSHAQSCGLLQARLTASGLSGFPAPCTWSRFIPKPFHTLLCILYNVIIFHLAKVQIKICKLDHFACVSLISHKPFELLV